MYIKFLMDYKLFLVLKGLYWSCKFIIYSFFTQIMYFEGKTLVISIYFDYMAMTLYSNFNNLLKSKHFLMVVFYNNIYTFI